MKAWHFVGDTLRGGRPVPADGEWLEHDGELKLCASGLHASRNILDALRYAPGSTICRVEVGGEILHSDDKLVASRRKILWRVDGEQLLRSFARMCALDVLDQWDAPDVVVRYLKTGDESIRIAAWAAARDAAWDAAGTAAWAAAGAPVWEAAREAAVAAARDAARDAAWDAAVAAAWAAARDAMWDAAVAAAWEAAGAPVWAKQSRRLERMVREARRTHE